MTCGGPQLLVGWAGKQSFQFLIQNTFEIQATWWQSKYTLWVPVFGLDTTAVLSGDNLQIVGKCHLGWPKDNFGGHCEVHFPIL